MRIQFGRHAYTNRHRSLAAQRCINLYPENLPEDAGAAFTLHGTPGLVEFADTSDGPIRAMAMLAGTLHVVGQANVYTVTSSGAVATVGSVGSGDIRVAASETELVIVGAGISRVVEAGSISSITDADFLGAFDVTYVDGYHVFVSDNGTWFISAVDDATSYDALDFLVAEANPDDLVGCTVSNRLIWMFGERTTEVYYNSGAADFPFARADSGVIEVGCAATDSIAVMDNSPFWLGDDRKFYRAVGFNPQRISTHAIEDVVRGYATISDAKALTYSQGGHEFYACTFPTEGATWVYDAATQMWHERASYGYGPWRVCSAIAAYGKILVGDGENGKIYELDLDTYTENGTAIVSTVASATVSVDDRRFSTGSLEVQIDPGQGLITGQGSDPQAMLRYSDDGGYTWSNERWAGIGKIGKYRNRARWTRLGQSRERVYEVSISDPVKRSIASEAFTMVSVGNA